jgi:hypothetical protein
MAESPETMKDPDLIIPVYLDVDALLDVFASLFCCLFVDKTHLDPP